MIRIALTGGIAAGKSTASRRLAELGARVVDYDVLSREAVADAGVLAALAERFGPEVVRGGELDRAALAARVFGRPDEVAALNAIVHPRVRALAAAADDQARADGVRVIVHDIPLLVDGGLSAGFGLVATVEADPELRVRRMVEGRGMPEADARARIASQVSSEQRAAVADVVLDGSGSVAALEAQVDDFWRTHVV